MPLHIDKVLNRNVTVLGLKPPLAVRCSPQTSIAEVTQILQSAQIGSIIITDKEKVVGIFTERDYLMKIAGKDLNLEKTPISQFMTRDPICIDSKSPIVDVLKKMRRGNFRHLIISDKDNSLVRVISIKDVANYLMDVLAESLEFDLDTDANTPAKAA